jgi:hypothetical protein
MPARGDGIPGLVGSGLDAVLAVDTVRAPNVVSSGEEGSCCVKPENCAGGVSSASETKTQPFGERNVTPDRSDAPEIGVEATSFVSAETLGFAARARAAEFEAMRFAAPRGMGPDTFRFGTFVPSLSSVALSLAWRSCRSLKPFVFADVVAVAALVELGSGKPILDLANEGEEDAPALARLRVVVDRARVGIPDGEDETVAENRLAAGDMVGMDVMVLDRAKP